MKGRRTQYEIFWGILIYCKTPKTYTSIIHKCNLNSKIAQDHLDFLLEKKYLLINKENNKTFYETSEKAQEFLTLFSKLYQKLFEENINQFDKKHSILKGSRQLAYL
jgi:predicted transcriptional regulator